MYIFYLTKCQENVPLGIYSNSIKDYLLTHHYLLENEHPIFLE